MVLEFAESQYIDMDNVQGLRWMPEANQNAGAGVIILNGDKMVINQKELFDVVESAFIYLHKSHMIDDKMKKVRFIRRKEGE